MIAYLKSTRHPLVALYFVLPLLIGYEFGVALLADGSDATELRNGADLWLRGKLVDYGVQFPWALPSLVAGILLLRAWWAADTRPQSILGGVFGTAVESIGFAVGLWLVARNFRPIMESFGLPLFDVPVPAGPVVPDKFQAIPAGQLVRYVGAGIYEEVLFRLMLFSLLAVLFKFSLLPSLITIPLAGATGSVLFAAAHHIGPHGEPVVPIVFAFRVVAGLLFTALYQFRGFGVAVGTHAGYDILVGVAVG